MFLDVRLCVKCSGLQSLIRTLTVGNRSGYVGVRENETRQGRTKRFRVTSNVTEIPEELSQV